jgi:hypothetical protein
VTRLLGWYRTRRSVRLTAGRRDAGAVLVEAGIALPLLMILIFGVVEVGALVRKAAVVSETVRAASLTLGNKGSSSDADLAAVTAVVDGMGRWSTDVETIIVYRVRTADTGQPSNQCLGNGALNSGGRMNECNVYDQATVQKIVDGTLGPSDMGQGTCPGELAKFWCATDRDATSTDRIGVYVRMRHTWVAGLFPGDRKITDFSVSRVVGEL